MRIFVFPAVVGFSLLNGTVGEVAAGQADRAPATIRVSLPADAKLTVDGSATTSTSATRSFVTPPLERGRDFHYTLKAEFVRGKQTITVQEVITVRAGQETVASLGTAESGGGNAAAWFPPLGSGTRSYYFNVVPDSAGPVPSRGYDPVYEAGSPPPSRAQTLSEQSPLRDAGPPGSNNPLSGGGVGQG